MRKLLLPFVVVLGVVPANAQRFEFGLGGGGSFYTSREVTNQRGTADAGFKSGWALTTYLGHNSTDLLGGEVRYTYLKNDLKLDGNGGEARFAGESHAVHYDLLFHTSPRQAPVRPYVSAGGGMKIYRGTGTEVVTQPLANLALLTRTTETIPLVSFGGGVKMRLSDHIGFRVDVRDYFTPFPKKLIAPNVGSRIGGWIHNIVPTAAIVFTY